MRGSSDERAHRANSVTSDCESSGPSRPTVRSWGRMVSIRSHSSADAAEARLQTKSLPADYGKSDYDVGAGKPEGPGTPQPNSNVMVTTDFVYIQQEQAPPQKTAG
jgi:hypothetical protein